MECVAARSWGVVLVCDFSGGVGTNLVRQSLGAGVYSDSRSEGGAEVHEDRCTVVCDHYVPLLPR